MTEEKMNMQTENLADQNFKKLANLFPNAVTEYIDENGKVQRAIDKDVLMQEINTHVVSDKEERYQFTWPEKNKAILLANSPISETLRPCVEESVGKDGTPGKFDSENLYIEGDNLDVLKLLQETYLGKIKMIYIDPPYNTGNDFVYADDFEEASDEYLARSGQFDKNGNKLVQNTENNGRFHTDWLNMIYPRLKLAKNLLSEDGVIFISIGEEELKNIISICNEIYGESNYISTVTRVAKNASNMGNFFAASVDYVVCYAKDINKTQQFKGDVDESLFKKIETEGKRKGEKYRDDVAFFQSGLKHGGSRYPIECPDGELVNTPDGKPWRASEETFLKWKADGMIIFKETNTSPLLDEKTGGKAHWNLYTKSYLKDRQEKGTQPRNILTDFINRKGADLIKNYGIPFDFAKPVELIEFLLKIINDKDCYILDFFSGSATTAHAVMNFNSKDFGNRKFIMVQLPELCEEKSQAYKEGYKNICEIGKERIRRAGTKIREENSLTTQEMDFGFRVLKLDSSNMKNVYYNPQDLNQRDLNGFIDNIKTDRTDTDLLFQIMLECGVTLSASIEELNICGKKVFKVADDIADNYLVACFDSDITDELVTQIAKMTPFYFVIRDGSLKDDSVAANFEQIFKTYSPETTRKVL